MSISKLVIYIVIIYANPEHSLITTSPISVDSSKEMLGTFSPQTEPYTHQMPEEVTPSGMFARGTYSARSKVIYIIL